MERPFVHLHVHSHYSLLYGACRISDLLDSCTEMGMSAIALTDRGSLFGAVEFFEQATARGIRPILGCDLYIRPATEPEPGSYVDDFGHRESVNHALTVLAKSDVGYGNLMKLSSAGYLDEVCTKPRIREALLFGQGDGLIVLGSARHGEVAKALMAGDVETAQATAERYRGRFGDDFYLEVIDHGLPGARELFERTAELGRKLGIGLVATNHVHYLQEDHAEAQDALLCIQTGKKKTDEDRFRFETREMYLKSPDQMYDLFSEAPEALTNTVKIAEQCQVTLEFGNLKLPPFPQPPEFATLDDYLTHLCQEGLKKRYSEITPEISERLDFELGIIHQMGYSGYFLIVMDFIDYARSINVPVGPGRGSAAGSLVSYCLRITNIDPMRYALLFERFLNPDRVSMPDIDVDFSDRGRGQVIQYVVEKYGANNVCQIITFGTMAARAAVRDVGRVMGMNYADVDRLAKAVPSEIGIKLTKALDQSQDLQSLHEADPQVRELITTALVIEGLSRHASTHAAGVIITPSALTNYVPLYRSGEDEITTQFDMNACDKIGLLKMDFLGLRTLTVLEDCLAMLSDRGIEIDLDALDLTDAETFALFGRGGTVGVFQFESSGMVEYLRKLKPEVIDDLIAMNALYRPGPLGSGMVDDFILRKHGENKIEYEHPILEPILSDTYGVIVYQEQVMQIASAMAGYSLGESDLLRRAMGKKKKSVMDEHRSMFVERSVGLEIPKRVAESVFDLMAHFAGYGFNKSHSAGYALVAFQTAFLKAHYPVEFMAASMTSEMTNSDRILIHLNEVRRMGIEVLPPAINESSVGFTVEDGKIRFGLGAIKGVGRNAVKAIVEMREERPFGEIYDLLERVDTFLVNKKCCEALAHAGAFDSFGWTRSRLLLGMPTILEWAARRRRDREAGQESIFSAATAPAPRPQIDSVLEWEPREKLQREKGALGFFVTGHPLDEYEGLLERLDIQTCAELEELGDNTPVRMCGFPMMVKLSTDRKGRAMAFFSLEDASGSIECLVFEEPLALARPHLTEDEPLWIKARLSKRGEERAKLIIEEAEALAPLIKKGGFSLHLAISSRLSEKEMDELRGPLGEFEGTSPVYLHVDHEEMGGVVIRCRSLRVRPDAELLARLRDKLGATAVRWSIGEANCTRSQEVFSRIRKVPTPEPRVWKKRARTPESV